MEGDAGAPHVVIIGGFLTEPLCYWPMRQRLLARGAARVSIAPIHLPDWAVIGFAGMGPLALRGARAVREARRQAPDPLLVIGHSMGGIVARLAMCPEPLDGRRASRRRRTTSPTSSRWLWTGVADDVACLVTLGTPHRLRPTIGWRHPGVRATEHLARMAPGAFHAPRTASLTVGSTLADPARRGPIRSYGQLLSRVLVSLVGETPGERGDGLVPDALCRLPGVEHIALPDVLHGTLGAPWYGNAEVIDRWWPLALERWRAALRARRRSHSG
jgi:hypothetical protein